MDDAKLQSIKEKIREKYDGEMSLLSIDEVEVIVRPPDRARFKRFQDFLFDEKKRGAAFEALVKSCMLYPSPAEYDEIADKRPAITGKLVEKLTEMAGGKLEVEEKKL